MRSSFIGTGSSPSHSRRTCRLIVLRLAIVILLLLIFAGSAAAQFPWAAPLPIFPYWHPKPITKGNWGHVAGRVAETDAATNSLVVTSHHQQVRFVVPPRIDLLQLEVGDRVAIDYIEDKGILRVWYLSTPR